MASDAAEMAEPVPIGAGREMSYWGRFYALLSVAAIVATIGLKSNSGAIVIAGMLLAPLMEPILGIASTLVQGYFARMGRLLAATGLAAVVTAAWGYAILATFNWPRSMEIPIEVMSRTGPGLSDLIVALVAGTAASYVQMNREEAGLLPGVAIGVSLVPPLAAAGMLLYFGRPDLAWEAALLFLTNLAAIVLTACVVFFALGLRPSRRASGTALRVTLGTAASFLVVLVIAGHLAERTLHHVREAREEQQITAVVREWAGDHSVEIRRVDVRGDVVEIRVLFRVPWSRADERVAPGELVPSELTEHSLKQRIAATMDRKVRIQLLGQIVFQEWMEADPPSAGERMPPN
jgi:uncharacterized hydrophobic protein (TIGR00271 family)